MEASGRRGIVCNAYGYITLRPGVRGFCPAVDKPTSSNVRPPPQPPQTTAAAAIVSKIALNSISNMADPAIEVAETIQSASVKQNPSPAHDINPPTSTSEKKQVSESAVSESDSIPSDIVDPSRMAKAIVRHRNLPPLPDLRFEQSYLASLKDADTWGRVAWITTRDQVWGTLLFFSSEEGCRWVADIFV